MTNIELAILGLLAEGPKHGYQIEQDIEQRGMRDWTEIGFSSIYYILNKLEAAGWLESRKESEGDRPTRKVYTLTPTGWGALHQAVEQRLSAPHPPASDFTLALANLPALTPQETLACLQTYRAAQIKRLENLHFKWDFSRQSGMAPHVNLLFSYSQALIQTEIDWVTQAIQTLQQG
jgi:DNA-binding PadR family transcriptional regulator